MARLQRPAFLPGTTGEGEELGRKPGAGVSTGAGRGGKGCERPCTSRQGATLGAERWRSGDHSARGVGALPSSASARRPRTAGCSPFSVSVPPCDGRSRPRCPRVTRPRRAWLLGPGPHLAGARPPWREGHPCAFGCGACKRLLEVSHKIHRAPPIERAADTTVNATKTKTKRPRSKAPRPLG